MNEKIQKAYASAPKTWLWQLLAAFCVACLLAWSGSAVRVSNPTGNGLEVAGNILSGIFHPSAKLLFTLGTDGVPYLLLETFCIAFLGTIVGAVISLPLSFLSASNLVPKAVALVGRVLIAAIRTIPAFVYGLMFIRVTGPGPFAGLLTMSLCSIGMVSKMFIESIEDLDKRILESLDAAGCTTFQKIRYGILPQLTADFTSTIIYRFDMNLRDATVLGLVGAVISLPLSFLSASNLVPKAVALVGRVLIAAIRTIPAFVYGLMFIRVTGPGPFAGLLTMSLCSIGMVSKMFIESIEDLDKRILESLDAAGCTTFQKIRYGILPQLTADFTSTIIYRFDMNLRDATVLGLVGAGGIGAPLIFAMSSYRWNEVGAILLGLIVLVLIIEWISAKIRVKLARG